MASTKRPASPKFKVACLECDKRFSTTREIPVCPKCGGVDITLACEAASWQSDLGGGNNPVAS